MRKRILSIVGRLLGLSFHMEGFPYGATPKRGSEHSASH